MTTNVKALRGLELVNCAIFLISFLENIPNINIYKTTKTYLKANNTFQITDERVMLKIWVYHTNCDVIISKIKGQSTYTLEIENSDI